jgi:anti-sigma B factor antagonist
MDMHGQDCSICVGEIEQTGIVEVAGEVDVATVSMLAKALGDAVDSGRGHLILDAQKLTYMDSSGIRTLLSTQRALVEKNRRFAIVGCHGVFHKILTNCKLDDRFDMYLTIDDALTGFQAE